MLPTIAFCVKNYKQLNRLYFHVYLFIKYSSFHITCKDESQNQANLITGLQNAQNTTKPEEGLSFILVVGEKNIMDYMMKPIYQLSNPSDIKTLLNVFISGYCTLDNENLKYGSYLGIYFPFTSGVV